MQNYNNHFPPLISQKSFSANFPQQKIPFYKSFARVCNISEMPKINNQHFPLISKNLFFKTFLEKYRLKCTRNMSEMQKYNN